MAFAQCSQRCGEVEEDLVRVDYVEGGRRIGEAEKDVAGSEGEVGMRRRRVGGRGEGDDGRGEVDACHLARWEEGEEGGGLDRESVG